VVADVPLAAVKGHLQRREVQPIGDELITKTYHAIVRARDYEAFIS
jgi:hypothetical protein